VREGFIHVISKRNYLKVILTHLVGSGCTTSHLGYILTDPNFGSYYYYFLNDARASPSFKKV
jgi:hypothetical protein